MKKVWRILGLIVPLLIATGMEFVVAIYAIVIYYQVYFTHGAYAYFVQKDFSWNLSYLLANIPYPSDMLLEYILYMMQLLWAVTFFFWYRELTRYEKAEPMKLFHIKNIMFIAILGLGFSASIGGLLEFILPHFQGLSEQYSELMETIVMGNPVMVFISTVIFAPIAEELMFRGVIMKKALRFAPFIVANCLQALLFGIFHMNIVQGVYAFAGGLLMGYLAYKFKTIWASILLHMAFNGANYVMPGPVAPWVTVIYVILGLCITVAAIILLNRFSFKKPATTSKPNPE